MGNSPQFAAQLEKEGKKWTAGKYRKFRDKLLFDALSIIDEAWPVDTGFSRASNLPFVHSPESGAQLPDPDPSQFKGKKATPGDVDAEKVARSELLLQTSAPFDTVGIATNCIYAPALEHGHSDQGSLMYTRAAQAVKNVVDTSEGWE